MVQAAQKLILHVAIFLVAHLLTLVSATEKHTKKIIHECSDYKILQVIHICISYYVSIFFKRLLVKLLYF